MRPNRVLVKSALMMMALLLFPVPCLAQDEEVLYPEIEPLRQGFLKVSDLHELYWEVCGNEEGIPVIVLHGGPGGTAAPHLRRIFDPEKYKIVLFDQRDAGRIALIPTFIVNGRYDMICPPATAHALASKLEKVRLEITVAGHSSSDPGNTEALIRGVKWVAERLE